MVTAVYRRGLSFWLVGTGRASSQISHKDLTRGQGSAKAGHCLRPWDRALHSLVPLSSPEFSSTHSIEVSCSMRPFPFMGVTTPPTAKTRVTTAPSQGWSHGANSPSRSCGSAHRAPKEGETPSRALSSSRASLRGSYPTLFSPSQTSRPIRFAHYPNTDNSWD